MARNYEYANKSNWITDWHGKTTTELKNELAFAEAELRHYLNNTSWIHKKIKQGMYGDPTEDNLREYVNLLQQAIMHKSEEEHQQRLSLEAEMRQKKLQEEAIKRQQELERNSIKDRVKAMEEAKMNPIDIARNLPGANPPVVPIGSITYKPPEIRQIAKGGERSKGKSGGALASEALKGGKDLAMLIAILTKLLAAA